MSGQKRTGSEGEWQGRRVTVMGLGTFGGGTGVVRYLVTEGAEVTVTDLRGEGELKGSLEELRETPAARYVLGEHREEDFREAELIVVNPAVPRENRFLEIGRKGGAELTSEMRLFWERNPARVIGVTGSNGKSTTTAMTHALLEAAGTQCRLGGNIGRSLLPELKEIRADEWVVLELSSFQLEDLDLLRASPDVGIVTNFTANHLDRHGTLEAYREAKQTLLRWQSPEQIAVLNGDDADVREWETKGRRLYFGKEYRGGGTDWGEEGMFLTAGGEGIWRFDGRETRFPICEWLKVPGMHNLCNALGATAAALSVGVNAGAIERGLRGYRALPHRLELVREWEGRRFYNDSLATTPESTERAIEAFGEPIVLLAGGYDKGSDLSGMAQSIVGGGVKGVALMGVTGPVLGRLIRGFDPEGRVRLHESADFRDAFGWCLEASGRGDVVLLSPGCASYGWFKNFAERGEIFRRLVGELDSQAGE